MRIDSDDCSGCGQCIPYCPVGAISLDDDVSEIDFDECTECGNCLRLADCPVDAIRQQELDWPRTVRSIFSDPLTIAQESGISGRGTEEMKTNTVFSLDIVTRVNPDGSIPTSPHIEAAGLWIALNGKTNVGLGRPRYLED